MKYLIALFTSKVVKEPNGRVIYIDPISKNGYKLTVKLAKQHNLLPMRFAVAAFAYLILYSLLPEIIGIPTELIFAGVVVVGAIGFEVYLYNQLLPKLSMYPNYQLQADKEVQYSKNKNITLLVAYILIVVLLVLYCFEKPNISTYIGASILSLAAVIRSIQILKILKK